MIEIDRLSKSFASNTVLHEISLQIREGEFLSLLGSSGCGKTTLLRILAGFEPPSSGRIYLRGEDITSQSIQKRPIAMVFQNYALFPHMSVEQNISYALSNRALDKNEISQKCAYYLELTDLTEQRKQNCRSLSGGEQQRTAFARALAAQPAVLLLDEPLSNIDARLREKMREEVRRLHQKTGITMIFVTHDQSEALYLSDRIALLERGKIRQVGSPQTLYEDPLHLSSALFIGQMNHLTSEQALFLGIETSGSVCLRPQSFYLGQGPYRAIVQDRFFMGETIGYQVSVGEISLKVLRTHHPGDALYQLGQTIAMGFQREQCLYFDAQGARVV